MRYSISSVLSLLAVATTLTAQTTGVVSTSGNTSPHAAAGVLIKSTSSTSPDVHTQLGSTSSSAGFVVFNSVDSLLLTVKGDGKVGIGTNTPATKLHILGDTSQFAVIEATNVDQSSGFQLRNDARQWQIAIVGSDSDKLQFRTYSAATGGLNALVIDNDGNVVVHGSLTANKVIGAVYQDLAEWVPATTDLTPGTVVVLNTDKTNEVMASHAAYDTGVAGVVSAQPGVLLGVEGAGKEQIATTGRVKVRVDARQHAIRVGDLLVTSDVAGTAMKSQPMEINGHSFHKPGTIVGKALEPLDGTVGEILVLLSLQ